MIKVISKNILFIISYLTLCYAFGYDEILSMNPSGDHIWRPSDGLSMAYTYYSEGNDFLEPKILNQPGNDGRAVGEFPILYFGVAQLYKVFGQSDSIYRLTCWIIGFLGYFALFKTIEGVLGDFKWGIIISLLTFTSPILIFYGISFLPDPISLSFVFISYFFLHRYSKRKKLVYYTLGMLFMTLAALIKITSLLSFIAIFTGIAIEHISNKKAVKLNWRLISITTIAILPIVAWIFFSKNYNLLNETSYFFLRIAPIWELSYDEFWITVDHISNWTREYFYPTGRHLTYIIATLIVLPIFKKSLGKSIYYGYLFSVIGFIIFMILFFQQFKNHDYYIIPLLFVIPFTFTIFLLKFSFFINKSNATKYTSQLVLTLLLIASAVYATNRTEKRFNKQTDWVYEELYNFEHPIENFGIEQTDLVIIPADPSPNINLYAIKMKGWTKYNVGESVLKIDDAIAKGAKWMILPNRNTLQTGYLENI